MRSLLDKMILVLNYKKGQETECGAEPNKLNKAGCGYEYHFLLVA